MSLIHKCLFEDVYDFAGGIRKENISKGNFRFVSILYLDEALRKIDKMPQSNFDGIIYKYIEMNMAHPFRDENEYLRRKMTYLQNSHVMSVNF